METVLKKLLTDVDQRSDSQIKKYIHSKAAFQPWQTEPES
jgi:hypothetical protein